MEVTLKRLLKIVLYSVAALLGFAFIALGIQHKANKSHSSSFLTPTAFADAPGGGVGSGDGDSIGDDDAGDDDNDGGDDDGGDDDDDDDG